jgi:hypothetical protein
LGHGAQNRRFEKDGETYQALKKWLESHITEKSFGFYTRARENFMSESFHSLINKYATKRIHFSKSHDARIYCAVMDWNENCKRECLKVIEEGGNLEDEEEESRASTSSRQREQAVRDEEYKHRSHKCLLEAKTFDWKDEIRQKIFVRV